MDEKIIDKHREGVKKALEGFFLREICALCGAQYVFGKKHPYGGKYDFNKPTLCDGRRKIYIKRILKDKKEAK